VSLPVIYSPRSLADLKRLYDFLKTKNPAAARRAIAAIRSGLRILAEQSQAGRAVGGEGAKSLREWLIPFGQSGYVAVYRIMPQKVIVLAIRHMSEAGY
jgi:addiction module RelE/StbE family toxin